MAARSVSPGLALFPLRLFLGGTFVYAGIQKLSDPGFLHPGAPTYIGTQLHSFATGTPGGFILRALALPHPELAGIGVAVLEILIGLLALTGLLTRAAAVAGLGLNLLLFLTSSWHTSPYFLGSDIVFVFAWLPFAIAGAADQPALDNALRSPSPELRRRTQLRPVPAAGGPTDAAISRRVLLGEIGLAALALAGISALLKGSYTGPTTSTATTSGGTGASSASGASAGGAGGSVPSSAVKLASSSRLGSGQSALYHDPSTGQPDILIRQTDGSLAAFSAICTHAGCTVGYQGGEIVCPCHGAIYNAQTGAVEGGPAPQGLAQKTVVERAGEIYAVPS